MEFVSNLDGPVRFSSRCYGRLLSGRRHARPCGGWRLEFDPAELERRSNPWLAPHQTRTFTVNGTPLTGQFFFDPSGLVIPACYSSSANTRNTGGMPCNNLWHVVAKRFPRSTPNESRSFVGGEDESRWRACTTALPGGVFQRAESHTMAATSELRSYLSVAGSNYLHLRPANRPVSSQAGVLEKRKDQNEA
jgi:hypothetical protein